MTGYVVLVIAVCLVAVALGWRTVQKNAAKRAARARYAHSEPGGPRSQHHGGASGIAAAGLSDDKRSGSV